MEDSGELITAVDSLGIAHQPGYPLFVLIGKLFSFLPIGSIAYRMNLFSAVSSGAAVWFLGKSLVNLSAICFRNLKESASLSILCGVVSLWVITIPAYFSQAVITEVYGLNNFLMAVLIWLATEYQRTFSPDQFARRTKLFCWTALVCGLSLTNHHTSAMWIPLLAWLFWKTDRRFLRSPWVWKGVGFFTLGLIPYLYLPIASAFDPAMDWGNPESWTNFWRVVFRHQYGLDLTTERTLRMWISQMGSFFRTTTDQLSWLGVFVGLLGLYSLWKRQRIWFVFSVGLLIFSGPLVAHITNLNLVGQSVEVVAEQTALAAVLYLPFYMYASILMGLGMIEVRVRWSRRVVTYALLAIAATGVIHRALTTADYESMRHYTYADDFAANLEKLVEPDAVILANWDPFAFPMMYYQHVEKRFASNILIDVELLRRSWYIDMLRNWYPDVIRRCQPEVEAFLLAVRPFEDGRPFNPHVIQDRYIRMMRSFVDRHPDRAVYATFYGPIRPMDPAFAQEYRWESCLVAYRLVRDSTTPGPISLTDFDLTSLTNPSRNKDRMARMLQNYHAILIAERAIALKGEDRAQSQRLLEAALELAEMPALREQIQLHLKAFAP